MNDRITRAAERSANGKESPSSSPDDHPLPTSSAHFRAPHLAEHDRQRHVEAERREKVIALKASLVALGEEHGVRYITYGGEEHLHEIMDLITRDLSEPYSIYTYRYFIYQWPKLCHLVGWPFRGLKLDFLWTISLFPDI